MKAAILICVCLIGAVAGLCPYKWRWRGWGPQWEEDLEDWAECAEEYAKTKLKEVVEDVKEDIVEIANQTEEIANDVFFKTVHAIEGAMEEPIELIEEQFGVEPNSTADNYFQDSKHAIAITLAVVFFITVFMVTILLVALCFFYKKASKIWRFIRAAQGETTPNTDNEVENF